MDPHFRAREMIISQKESDGSELLVPGIVPKLSRTPGQLKRTAPDIGQDNEDIFKQIGLTESQIQALYSSGVIWSNKINNK